MAGHSAHRGSIFELSDLYPLIERNAESVQVTVTVGERTVKYSGKRFVRTNGSFGGRGFTDFSAKMFAVGEKGLGREGRKALRPGRHTLQHKSFPRRFAYFAKQNSAKCYPSNQKEEAVPTLRSHTRKPCESLLPQANESILEFGYFC